MGKKKASRKATNPVVGRWRITWMDQWDQEFGDAEFNGFFEFRPAGRGEFHFGNVHGEIDYRETTRDGDPCVLRSQIQDTSGLQQKLPNCRILVHKLQPVRVFKSVTLSWKHSGRRYGAIERAEVEPHHPFALTGTPSILLGSHRLAGIPAGTALHNVEKRAVAASIPRHQRIASIRR